MDNSYDQRSKRTHKTILIVGLLGLIGIGSAYLLNGGHPDPAKTTTTTQTQKSTSASNDTTKPKPIATTPAGYVDYQGATAGYTIAYPAHWGAMSRTASPAGDPNYQASTPQFMDKLGTAMLEGTFTIYERDKTGFMINLDTFKDYVAPSRENGTLVWKIAKLFDPTTATNNVGDLQAIPSFQTLGGTTAYDLSWHDHGFAHSRWVFETTAKYIIVELPTVWVGTKEGDVEPASGADHQAYLALAKNILNSLRIQP
jgi:hypothetical protein